MKFNRSELSDLFHKTDRQINNISTGVLASSRSAKLPATAIGTNSVQSAAPTAERISPRVTRGARIIRLLTAK